MMPASNDHGSDDDGWQPQHHVASSNNWDKNKLCLVLELVEVQQFYKYIQKYGYLKQDKSGKYIANISSDELLHWAHNISQGPETK